MNYFLIFAILLLIISIYIQIAKYLNIVDQPNARSSHQEVTIRGGGIIFPIGALIWFFFSGFQYPIFFLGLTILSIISFWDDLKQLPFYIRLLFQFAAIILLFSDLGFQHYSWWIWIFVFVVATGIINAFNFMDGINGITGAYSLAVISGLWIINTYSQHFIENELIHSVSIGLILFCFFNFRKKAICFAGDVGSISIAFIIVFLIAKLVIQTGNLLYLLLIGLYGIDSILTILYRIRNHENIFEAHRKHIYQLMANELQIPHLIISSIYAISQFIICILIFLTLKYSSNATTIWIVGLTTLISLIAIFTIARNKIIEIQVNKVPELLLRKYKDI